MREGGDRLKVPLPSHTKGAQRKRRLARGIRRWDQDLQLCAEPVRRVATVTLTVVEDELEAAAGRVRTFFRHVRQQWLGTRYFAWLELQGRGAAHYHVVWLNPPVRPHREMYAWVDRAWGPGRTQYRVHYQRGALQKELDYALSYAKKMGKKSYQQRYDEVPSSLRTFMSQRLEIPPRVLDEHRTYDSWAYVAPDRELWGDHEPRLVRVATWTHDLPAGARCEALDFRRARYRKRERLKSGLRK